MNLLYYNSAKPLENRQKDLSTKSIMCMIRINSLKKPIIGNISNLYNINKIKCRNHLLSHNFLKKISWKTLH